MRIATWNVNSIRARVERVTDWLQRADVDVLAMQETKCSDEQFPVMPFLAAGYEVAHCGFNQWNGGGDRVAGRHRQCRGRLRRSATWSDKPEVEAAAEARALGATCNGVRVWSLYVPNGRFVGSPPHYAYKLEWLAALRDTAHKWVSDEPSAPIALVGDWNIAPTDEDVWSVDFYQNSTHVTAPERAAFDAIVEAGFTDVVRPFTPPGPPAVFTYWDYTQLRFPKNRGMRIDFILGSPAFAQRVAHGEIVRDERKSGKDRIGSPSDHAPPVLVELT